MSDSKKFYINSQKFGQSIWTITYKILKETTKGKHVQDIADEIGVSKQKVSYHLKKLEKADCVTFQKKGRYKFYHIKESGRSLLRKISQTNRLGVRKSSQTPNSRPVRTHALRIKVPISKQNPHANFKKEINYEKKKKRNWTAHYFDILHPIEAKIEVTTQSVVINLKKIPLKSKNFMGVYNDRINKAVWYIYEYFRSKYDIKLDFMNTKMIWQELANELESADNIIKDSTSERLNLGRKAIAPLKTNMKAQAWIDKSEGYPEIETNDLNYEKKLLEAPERLDRVQDLLEFHAENSASHAGMIKEIYQLLKILNTKLENLGE